MTQARDRAEQDVGLSAGQQGHDAPDEACVQAAVADKRAVGELDGTAGRTPASVVQIMEHRRRSTPPIRGGAMLSEAIVRLLDARGAAEASRVM